jgi:hypothetical protein
VYSLTPGMRQAYPDDAPGIDRGPYVFT